jgi:hypothetical protein
MIFSFFSFLFDFSAFFRKIFFILEILLLSALSFLDLSQIHHSFLIIALATLNYDVGAVCNSKSLYLRSSLFWNLTQRRLVVSYRSCETTYRSHLQESTRNSGNYIPIYEV